jgi:sugar phosphate isomerase/epimerase
MSEKLIRVGTTSYIIAADILPNVRYLGPIVDDIELVLFESEGASNLPERASIEALSELADEHDLTYTVHFPLDIYPGSSDRVQRTEAVSMIERIIALTEELDPFGYVLHLTPDYYGTIPSDDVPVWRSCLDQSLGELVARDIVDPKKICAETLSYPFHLVEDLVEAHGLSITLDIGHIWLMGYDADEAIERYLPKARICHLHGVKGDTDHLSLTEGDRPLIETFLTRLSDQSEKDQMSRVLTLELFNDEDLRGSLSLLKRSHDKIAMK